MSAPTPIPERYREILEFIPRWIPDPAPEWWLRNLDKAQLNQVARVYFEYEKALLDNYKAVLEAKNVALQKIMQFTK